MIRSLIVFIFIISIAYYAGTQGIDFQDILFWLEKQGIPVSQFLEDLPKKMNETVDDLQEKMKE